MAHKSFFFPFSLSHIYWYFNSGGGGEKLGTEKKKTLQNPNIGRNLYCFQGREFGWHARTLKTEFIAVLILKKEENRDPRRRKKQQLACFAKTCTGINCVRRVETAGIRSSYGGIHKSRQNVCSTACSRFFYKRRLEPLEFVSLLVLLFLFRLDQCESFLLYK